MTFDGVTPAELYEASSALREWFKSQDLTPALAVVVSEMFIARCMVANMVSPTDLEKKFELCNTTIRCFARTLQDSPQ